LFVYFFKKPFDCDSLPESGPYGSKLDLVDPKLSSILQIFFNAKATTNEERKVMSYMNIMPSYGGPQRAFTANINAQNVAMNGNNVGGMLNSLINVRSAYDTMFGNNSFGGPLDLNVNAGGNFAGNNNFINTLGNLFAGLGMGINGGLDIPRYVQQPRYAMPMPQMPRPIYRPPVYQQPVHYPVVPQYLPAYSPPAVPRTVASGIAGAYAYASAQGGAQYPPQAQPYAYGG
jgi:hypothetical protein